MITSNCVVSDYVCMKSDSSGPIVVTSSTWGGCYKLSGGWLVANNWTCTDDQYIATPSAYLAPQATISANIDIASSSAIAIGLGQTFSLLFTFLLVIIFILLFTMGKGFFKYE